MFPRSPKCSPEVQNVPRPLVAVVTAFRDSALIGIQKIDNFKGHFFNLLEYLQDYPLFFRIFQAIPGEARQEEHRPGHRPGHGHTRPKGLGPSHS